MPVSFSDKALARFSSETEQPVPATRELLKTDPSLYSKYIRWWQEKRKAFFVAIRDSMRDNGVDDALVLYTGSPGEPGAPFATWDPLMVTDRPDVWKPILAQPEQLTDKNRPINPLTPRQVVDDDLYLKALTSPGLNWGNWEIHHSRPADDPEHYKDTKGVLFSHAFNRGYTVASAKTLDLFRGPSGLALIRHYALNENMMFDQNDKDMLGYFVADVERAGPFCMMAEALAVAEGDPTMIGYLSGNNFGRGFPTYVRNFNAHYLALPALPSERLESASSDPDVVVRRIATRRNGIWLAVVNTAWLNKSSVSIIVPPGNVTDAVTGDSITSQNGKITLDLYPCQLQSFRIQ